MEPEELIGQWLAVLLEERLEHHPKIVPCIMQASDLSQKQSARSTGAGVIVFPWEYEVGNRNKSDIFET